jgi:hypothetical protein
MKENKLSESSFPNKQEEAHIFGECPTSGSLICDNFGSKPCLTRRTCALSCRPTNSTRAVFLRFSLVSVMWF